MVIILPGLVSPSRRWSCRSSSSRFLWEIHWCDRTPSTRPGQRCWMWNNDQQKLKGKYQYCLSEWYVKSLLSINICSNYIFVDSLSFRSSCRTENVRQKFCFTYCKSYNSLHAKNLQFTVTNNCPSVDWFTLFPF